MKSIESVHQFSNVISRLQQIDCETFRKIFGDEGYWIWKKNVQYSDDDLTWFLILSREQQDRIMDYISYCY